MKESDVMAKNIEYSKEIDSLGVSFTCRTKDDDFSCYICSPGEFSIYNALAVISVCRYLKVDQDIMINSLKKAKVNGRVEVLPVLPYATVIVDYAHNGVSLENILQTLKKYDHNRLICLFGSVGGRTEIRRKELGDVAARECDLCVSLENILQTLKKYDHNRLICLFGSVGGRTEIRRKELGDVAARECDLCILTSDNPDFEDPMNVIRDIAESFEGTNCEYVVEPDRKVAIEMAIEMAKEGDMIVFAGKGHETYQLIKGERIPFSEKEIAINAARKLKEAALII